MAHYTTEGSWILDEDGYRRILRGVNLGGSTKVPFSPDGATWRQEGFYDYKGVSFVGRPFPLEEADQHLKRLKDWGFNFLRLLTTWEAVEHDGPGLYDREYLDYLAQVAQRASDFGFTFFIDPHQDVWSRWTGGDGAPAWTMEILGMEIRRLHETGAAILHQEWGDPFPRMIWPLNYDRYGAATMLSLFFAGRDLAPATQIEGQSVQDFLQQHFTGAMMEVAKALKGIPGLVGFGTFNEPHQGFVGIPDLREISAHILHGGCPTPWQAIQGASGYSQRIKKFSLGLTGARRRGWEDLNPTGVSLWKEGAQCVWKENGLWDAGDEGPVLLKPHWFKDRLFGDNYLVPFMERYSREILSILPEALIFIEGVPSGLGKDMFRWKNLSGIPSVHALHWYDGPTLFLKRFFSGATFETDTRRLILGKKNVQKSFNRQIGRQAAHTKAEMGNIPNLVGEFGVPFDLNGKKSFTTGNFAPQTKALDMYYNALDANLLSSTQWNYTADNNNERGDNWNDEDLSLFSREQGGRAVEGFSRPYARKTPGTPLSMSFDRKSRTFRFRFIPLFEGEVEIFLPPHFYPAGGVVQIDRGEIRRGAEGENILSWRVAPQGSSPASMNIIPKEGGRG